MINKSNFRTSYILTASFCLFILHELSIAGEHVHPLLEPTFLSNGSYCEAYKLSALLDDETFIETEMVVTNIGFRDSNAACQIMVLHPGEKQWKASKRFNKTEWNYADTPNPALSIGRCRLAQENDSTICTMMMGSAMVTLSFGAAPDPVKTPAAINAGGEKDQRPGKSSTSFYTYEMLIPWSRLRAAITLPGRPEKRVSGSGILVNSRSVGYPKDFSRGWVYCYGCLSGCRFLANFRFPLHDSGVAGWIWKNNEQSAQPVTSMRVTYEQHIVDGKKKMSVVISAPDSSFMITSRLELCRFSIIDDLGPVLGAIIKLVVGNPVTRFYQSEVTQSPSGQPAQGVLEVMRFE